MVNFDATGSYDPDGSGVLYSWNFADGQTATGNPITHTFGSPGIYHTMVLVRDSKGLSSSPVYLEIQVLGPSRTLQTIPATITAEKAPSPVPPVTTLSAVASTSGHITMAPSLPGAAGSVQPDDMTPGFRFEEIPRFLSRAIENLFSRIGPPKSPDVPRNIPQLADGNLSRIQFFAYLEAHPRIRAQMKFETAPDTFLLYDSWPQEWKERLFTFYLAYVKGDALPIAQPLPLAPANSVSNERVYRSAELARDTYLAQVSHAIWLDISGKVPWRIDDWSDEEQEYLLSSRVFFSVTRDFSSGNLLYYTAGKGDSSYNVFADPRIVYAFMEREPEQGRSLIGATPSETGASLSEWFHDYVSHSPLEFRTSAAYVTFYQDHPLLQDRLRRHPVSSMGNDYVVIGCHDASSLFADLMRTVNIPVKRVSNVLWSPTGEREIHSGLVFDWQGTGQTGRYLLHTDDLYLLSGFADPSPAPKDTPRGTALWDHAWLNESEFGRIFTFSHEPGFFAEATFPQKVLYNEQGQWRMPSGQAIEVARSLIGRESVIDYLKRERRVPDEVARVYWSSVEQSVLSYGDGDLDVGFQRLLDGPYSRHGAWCNRTAKCP
jgi:PKD repeat protein